jgi:hypothetical protein
MRLLLKLAFLIGLALFFLAPARQDQDGMPAGLSAGALFFAAQQTVADLGGFCERSPMACESGRDAIHFAGARIAEGLTFVYGLAVGTAQRPNEPTSPPAAVPEAKAGDAPSAHQPRVPAAPPPRPYLAPAG